MTNNQSQHAIRLWISRQIPDTTLSHAEASQEPQNPAAFARAIQNALIRTQQTIKLKHKLEIQQVLDGQRPFGASKEDDWTMTQTYYLWAADGIRPAPADITAWAQQRIVADELWINVKAIANKIIPISLVFALITAFVNINDDLRSLPLSQGLTAIIIPLLILPVGLLLGGVGYCAFNERRVVEQPKVTP